MNKFRYKVINSDSRINIILSKKNYDYLYNLNISIDDNNKFIITYNYIIIRYYLFKNSFENNFDNFEKHSICFPFHFYYPLTPFCYHYIQIDIREIPNFF